MGTLARVVAVSALVSAAVMAAPAFAATQSELHITVDGKLTAKNLVVLQKSGTTLFCRGIWGSAFVRLTVLTVPDTIPALIVRNHGGTTTVDEIQQGDLISVEGVLVPAADSLQINAKRVVDFSLNKEPKTLTGVIKSITGATFVLPNKTLGSITVAVGATTTIEKGIRTISAAELKAGDKILSLTGTYDYTTGTFAAASIIIHQDKSVFNPHVFEGTVRQLAGTALPTSIIIDSANTSYTVYLSAGTQILSTNRAATTLSRFAAGDKVRVYGTIRQDNLANIDASIVRDLNF